MATKSIRYVEEGRQQEYDEASPAAYPPDDHLVPEEEASEPRCPGCGELLAWHEEACAPLPSVPPQPVAAPALTAATTQAYAYEVGHLVQPVPEAAAHPIIWRGQLRERHPQTGLVHRVNVYRLGDGFWDCYREEELQVA